MRPEIHLHQQLLAQRILYAAVRVWTPCSPCPSMLDMPLADIVRLTHHKLRQPQDMGGEPAPKNIRCGGLVPRKPINLTMSWGSCQSLDFHGPWRGLQTVQTDPMRPSGCPRFLEDLQRTTTERHPVFAVSLRARGRDGPHALSPVDLRPDRPAASEIYQTRIVSTRQQPKPCAFITAPTLVERNEEPIPQLAGIESYPLEWTSNSPGSNLEGGTTRGGRSVRQALSSQSSTATCWNPARAVPNASPPAPTKSSSDL